MNWRVSLAIWLSSYSSLQSVCWVFPAVKSFHSAASPVGGLFFKIIQRQDISFYSDQSAEVLTLFTLLCWLYHAFVFVSWTRIPPNVGSYCSYVCGISSVERFSVRAFHKLNKWQICLLYQKCCGFNYFNSTLLFTRARLFLFHEKEYLIIGHHYDYGIWGF